MRSINLKDFGESLQIGSADEILSLYDIFASDGFHEILFPVPDFDKNGVIGLYEFFRGKNATQKTVAIVTAESALKIILERGKS